MKIVNLIGEKFGRLLVIRNTEKISYHHKLWECLCDCGNICYVQGDKLKSGNTKSCGCLHIETSSENGKANRQDDRKSILNRNLYRVFKNHISRKHITNTLNFEEYCCLVSSDCFYCGAHPDNEFKYPYSNETIIYNGIDRVDNDKGYSLENSVPCCKRCNVSKNNMKLDDFKKWIISIYNKTILNKYE